VIVDDEKVERREDAGINLRGHDRSSYRVMTTETRLGVALQVDGAMGRCLLNSIYGKLDRGQEDNINRPQGLTEKPGPTRRHQFASQ